MSDKGKMPQVGVKILKSQFDVYEDPIYDARKTVKKAEKAEQLNLSADISASEWISKPFDMRGLEMLVQHSTILPQCIRAYRNNIAGFGISVHYREDIEETEDAKTEWDTLKRIIDLLNLDIDTKEVFEKVIEARETYGIAYIECIRNMDGQLAEIDFIEDTPTIEMTYHLEPYVDVDYSYYGETVTRKKKFKKYRQTVGANTVYFKEFGDPRVMNKTDGTYVKEGETLDIDMQANELLEFKIGNGYYGLPRWIGQTLTVDGDFRAEKLNNNYFRNGRHTPLMIMVQGGTLSDESFEKLRGYMDDIKGEDGQHSFIVLEAERNETTTDFTDDKQPSVEVKDLASILQTDGLFQEYQNNGRKKIQSSFLLPDLYVGYTTDFNRATAQTAMEITEKQVFQPERVSLAWQINNKLLNGYSFEYVEAGFNTPDMTNPDDIYKMLLIAEKAGGLTPNDARDIAMDTLGKEAENYPEKFDMKDIGNIPLAVISAIGIKSMDQNSDFDNSLVQFKRPLDDQIEKAMHNHDDEIVAIMKEVRKALIQMGGAEDVA